MPMRVRLTRGGSMRAGVAGALALVLATSALALRDGEEARPNGAPPRQQVRIDRVARPAGHRSSDGQASWYARTGMCAASASLGKGTLVRVAAADGRSVTVIIEDRGPRVVGGRVIDLCETAFARLAPLDQGVIPVSVGW
jgi:rare lipoprotein A (peptidoglycan hydrolase)